MFQNPVQYQAPPTYQEDLNRIDPQLLEEKFEDLPYTEKEVLEDHVKEKGEMYMKNMRDMIDGPLENLSHTENVGVVMNKLLQDNVEEKDERDKMYMRDNPPENLLPIYELLRDNAKTEHDEIALNELFEETEENEKMEIRDDELLEDREEGKKERQTAQKTEKRKREEQKKEFLEDRKLEKKEKRQTAQKRVISFNHIQSKFSE